MGPFKFIGKIFASITNTVDLADNSINHAKNLQRIEHSKELLEAMNDFNSVLDGNDIEAVKDKTEKNLASVDRALELFNK